MREHDTSVWKLDGSLGRFTSGALSAQVDVSQPQRGLIDAAFDRVPLAERLFAIGRSDVDAPLEHATRWPVRLNEAYIRANDLIASYDALEEWPYAPQVYWHVDQPSDGVLGALTLLVSVQTHLLDTHPRINITSQLAADEIVRVVPHESDVQVETLSVDSPHAFSGESSPCCLLWRADGAATTYCEIMLAGDFHRLDLHGDEYGTCLATWRLFAEFLEKGVIRRARLLSVVLPRENDVELGAACCRAFARRPLPLTT